MLCSGSMSNILEVPQQQAIQALVAKGWSVRRIASTLGINRRTVKRYAAAAPKCTAEVIAGSVPPEGPKCTTGVIAGSAARHGPKCATQVIAGSRSSCSESHCHGRNLPAAQHAKHRLRPQHSTAH